jgi:hypothetical protein
VAQIEIWAIGKDDEENGRQKLCIAEIKLKSNFQQKQTKLMDNSMKEMDLNYSDHFNGIGINYGPKWKVEFIKLAKNKWKMCASNRLENGIQFLFNPILLEATIIQAFFDTFLVKFC